MSRAPITTHVLDTIRGQPADNLAILLEKHTGDGFEVVSRRITNADGRLDTPLIERPISAGIYRLTFDTAAYFAVRGLACFYPKVQIAFEITDPDSHYHVPLLLSPYSYSTYRGS